MVIYILKNIENQNPEKVIHYFINKIFIYEKYNRSQLFSYYFL